MLTGSTQIIALYTCTTRKCEKRVVFKVKSDSHKSRIKMCLFFKERVLLDSIKGCLGSSFQTPPSMSSNNCLGVTLGQNHAKFSFRGCFPWRREMAIRGCFENLWSRIQCKTLVFECPPPTKEYWPSWNQTQSTCLHDRQQLL